MQFRSRVFSMLLCLSLALSLCVPVSAAATEAQTALASDAAFVLSQVPTPQFGSIGGEWAVIGLARSGCTVPDGYFASYLRALQTTTQACQGVLSKNKYTEFSRAVLALTAIGADPSDVGGYNLLTPLADYDAVLRQGVNGPIWALLALDSGDYAMPVCASGKQATRQMYVDEILSTECSGGGWSMSGSADADLTAMALQALSNYQEQAAVKASIDRALGCLSGLQGTDGGFGSCESAAQALCALSALDISVSDSRFVKGKATLLDNLLSYSANGGGFLHTAGDLAANEMASEQALCALAAVSRAERGLSSLYSMQDVKKSGAFAAGSGLPGKSDAVQAVPIVDADASFSDTVGTSTQAAVEALAARGILNGRSSRLFEPNATMTRAEFAATAVRALGLPVQSGSAFSDVPTGSWYAGFVSAASAYGIVSGVSDTAFCPSGTITVQEAAVMLARAGALCGLSADTGETAVRDTLSQFSDYTASAQWARTGLAFCYQTGILDDSALTIEPTRAVTRGELAQMVYNLLVRADLLAT